MNPHLGEILGRIGERYRHDIAPTSRFYCEVDIGRVAEELGFRELTGRYRQVYAIVPLKRPRPGMTVRVDGRTFVNYAQYDSGVAVPGYVAAEAGLPARPFAAPESMVLNFA
jgi:hypothetical protein